MDFSEAKKIFYACYGSHFFIDREYGKVYYKYKVPKDLEKIWLMDIQQELYTAINNSFGHDQFEHVCNICLTLNSNNSAKLLLSLLQNGKEDSFTRLLYCEDLARIMRDIDDNLLKNNILQEIMLQKLFILSNPKNIDEKYKLDNYCNLVEEKLIKRLNELLDNLHLL